MVLMMMSGCAALFPFLNADADGDGLSDEEEEALGLDPHANDTDGDGLSDLEEVRDYRTDPLDQDTDDDRLTDGLEIQHNADPLVPDTDEDGYLDGDEVVELTDPTDPASVIYQGGWPYYFDKDALEEADAPTEWEAGRRIPRFDGMIDQFGDAVDLYDFYNTDGKPVIVVVMAPWVGPARQLAGWLVRNENGTATWMDPFAELRDAVDQGDIYWITVMGESVDGAPAGPSDAAAWHQNAPHDAVPVLADSARKHQELIGLGGWPATHLLTGELEMHASDPFGVPSVAAAALELMDELQESGR